MYMHAGYYMDTSYMTNIMNTGLINRQKKKVNTSMALILSKGIK